MIFSGITKLFECRTLELPWKDNAKRVSCVPPGQYKLVKHNSPKFGPCWMLDDVAGRDFILIHAGNYYTDIQGCVLIGKDFVDINKDNQLDVTSSKVTLKEAMNIINEGSTIEIVSAVMAHAA